MKRLYLTFFPSAPLPNRFGTSSGVCGDARVGRCPLHLNCKTVRAIPRPRLLFFKLLGLLALPLFYGMFGLRGIGGSFMIFSLRSGTYGGEFLIHFRTHSLLNVTLVGVWILLMLVFTLASPFLFRDALPQSPTPAMGIELRNTLNMLIGRDVGLLLTQALLKSTLMDLLGEILVWLVLGELGMIVLVISSFCFLYTRLPY